MSYIGAEPTIAAFPFDQFSGNGTQTSFTLTYAPASTTSIIVAISGVVQNPNLYSVIGTTLTFSPAPPTGTNNISVLYLGLPVIGVPSPGNTAYFSSTTFTATGGQTTFTPSGSYTPGFINVIRNGAQLAPANYTATNGTTVVLNNACTAGDTIVIEVFTLTSISNALPLTGGTVTGQSTFNSGVNLAVNSGNVGIGTSSPNGKLAVIGSSSATLGSLAQFTIPGGQGFYLNSNSTGLLNTLAVGTGENLAFNTGSTERARIDASGNVGIGTSTIFERMQLSGNFGFSSGGYVGFYRNGTTANITTLDGVTISQFGVASGVATGRSDASTWLAGFDSLRLVTQGNERARIDASGNLLVGTTGTIVTNYQSRFGVMATTFNGNQGFIGIGATIATSVDLMQFINPNGLVGRISTSGSATSYVTSSDYRLKEEIAPMTGALAKVAALKPCTYKWKADGSDGEGFIAHELAEVVPDAVTGEKDAVDEDGNIKPQGIDTSFLVATLTAGLQEAVAMIEELKAKVAALEARS